MKFLHKIDRWLIERPYQGLIDVTGKAPAWWCEQCAFGIVLGAATRIACTDSTSGWLWVGIAFDLLFACAFFAASRMPSLLDFVGQWWWQRLFLLVLNVVCTPFVWWRMGAQQIASDAIYSVALLSFYYFAACVPPRPREPRRKLAGGAA